MTFLRIPRRKPERRFQVVRDDKDTNIWWVIDTANKDWRLSRFHLSGDAVTAAKSLNEQYPMK